MPAVGAAIAAAATWVAANATILLTVAKLALTVGLSYLTQQKPNSVVQGIKFQVQVGGVIPRSFMFGYFATAGSIVYVNTYGRIGDYHNVFLVHVIALSDLPITDVIDFEVSGAKVTWDRTQPATEHGYPIKEFLGTSGGVSTYYMRMKVYDGTQTTADSFLTSTFGTDPNFPWASTAIGKGCAYAIITTRLNPQLFSGVPTFKWGLKGAKFYDQRKDSTAGGSGSQRFTDSSTWAYTENPMVVANHIFRGIYYGGRLFYGPRSMNVNRLPTSSWFAAMNECDVAIAGSSGGAAVAQFRCGGELAVSVEPLDAIEALGKCCNARIVEIGATYKVLVGAVAPSVFDITDDDIVISAPQSFDEFPGKDQLVNGISATYPEPAENWTNKDAPLRKDDDAIEQDGGEYFASVNYSFVPFADQVQRLMSSALGEARKFRRHAFQLGPPARVLEPNDVLTWTSGRNGYSSKSFRLDQVINLPNLDVAVSMSEVDPADYDFNPSTDYISNPTTTPPLTLPPAGQPAPDEVPGAFGNTREFNDGNITASSATFTSLSTTFVSGDVGKLIWIMGAGAVVSGPAETLMTTISAIVADHIVTVAAAASTTVTAAHGYFGTDDAVSLAKFFTDNEGGSNSLGRDNIFMSTTKQTVRMRKLDWNGSKIVFGIPNHTDSCLELAPPPDNIDTQANHRFWHWGIHIDCMDTGDAGRLMLGGSPSCFETKIENAYDDGTRWWCRPFGTVATIAPSYFENVFDVHSVYVNSGRHLDHVLFDGDNTFFNNNIFDQPEGRTFGRRNAGCNAHRITFKDTADFNTKHSTCEIRQPSWDVDRARGVGDPGPPVYIASSGSSSKGRVEFLSVIGGGAESTSGTVPPTNFIDADATIQAGIAAGITTFGVIGCNMERPVHSNWSFNVPDWYLNVSPILNHYDFTTSDVPGEYGIRWKARPNKIAVGAADLVSFLDPAFLNANYWHRQERPIFAGVPMTFEFIVPPSFGFAYNSDGMVLHLLLTPFADGGNGRTQAATFRLVHGWRADFGQNYIDATLLSAESLNPTDERVTFCFNPDDIVFSMSGNNVIRMTVTGGAQCGAGGANTFLKMFFSGWGAGFPLRHQYNVALPEVDPGY